MTLPQASSDDLWCRLARVVNLEYQRHPNNATVVMYPGQPEPDRFTFMGISGSSTNDFSGSIELTISLEGRHFRAVVFLFRPSCRSLGLSDAEQLRMATKTV